MKIKFKQQAYQTEAVASVADCFKGQAYAPIVPYHIDPGVTNDDQGELEGVEGSGFKNGEISLRDEELLSNIQAVQRRQNLPQSKHHNTADGIAPVNLDIEMETGTGKTYCYIKTIFELNRQFGWSKFIVVVPSIAIREGVFKSFAMTAEHFHETYAKKARFFIYHSKQLHRLESFASDAGINVMVINVQAFNAQKDARGKDNRRIYDELDAFQSRKPIDVIRATRPILILDEPQKMEGKKTLAALKEFKALFALRYSATHKTEHNKIHRLDALDAYNQKLVKKIAVRGISVKGLAGTHAYLYLESINVSTQAPVARVEMEIKQRNGIKRVIRKLKKGDNLYDLSGELDQYKQGYVVADINALTDFVTWTNGLQLHVGEATGNVNEETLRRIQIREAIAAHLEKERVLFPKGIKVLTLFFIDEVKKYRLYSDSGEEQKGDYARIFEEEYQAALDEWKQDGPAQGRYKEYLEGIAVHRTHNGYFSIDKKTKRMVDPVVGKKSLETDDVNAYDLILKDKERLLSFEEPTRFIFSHSALREGWDNPNVFVMCMLKHSDNTISRRQEVGRGLRLAVNQHGERQDDSATVHDINELTVVANESYHNFVSALQQDISESLAARPRQANAAFFIGKTLNAPEGPIKVTKYMAQGIEDYLVENRYVDRTRCMTQEYHDAVKTETLAALPEDLKDYQSQVMELIELVYSDAKLPEIENDRGAKNRLNDNFEKQAFKEIWSRINHKAAYSVHFDSAELIDKCVAALDQELKVARLQYTTVRGEQREDMSAAQLRTGEGFEVRETSTEYGTHTVRSKVKYDLIGKVATNVQLTRKTVAAIFTRIQKATFDQYKTNPENFINEASRLIQEQKATVIVEHLSYDVTEEKYHTDIFTSAQTRLRFKKAAEQPKPLKRHIYDYVVTDSDKEVAFAKELDTSTEVKVYAKLPKGFAIPTPVGNYNPDWAIAFEEGSVKHVYFVAETKGSMSTMQLRGIEKTKTHCAAKFFAKINRTINPKNVHYGVVTDFDTLMNIVGAKSTLTSKLLTDGKQHDKEN